MPKMIDYGASAIAGLALQGHTLMLLVQKGLISDQEAHDIILKTGDQVSPEDPVQKQLAQEALMAVFPSVKF